MHLKAKLRVKFSNSNQPANVPGDLPNDNWHLPSKSIKKASLDSTLDVTSHNWMACLPEKLTQLPIWSLTLPGSHDSGSYALESKDGISPDKAELRKWWMRVFGFIAYPIVKRWTITQTMNMTQQLEAGIRYFDLRAAPKPSPTNLDLYFVHGLYGPRIVDICRDINSFLNENPQEIVIIHIQHFISATVEQQLHLLLDIFGIFKQKVCPYNEQTKEDASLDTLWHNGHQVFLFYPGITSITSPYLWPPQYLPNPWANTTNANNLEQFLSDQVRRRSPDSFYVTQGVLTPTDAYVKEHLLSSLYRRLVSACNTTMVAWLDNYEAGPRGPNIVMTDFIEWNNFEIPRKVIEMNYKMHTR